MPLFLPFHYFCNCLDSLIHYRVECTLSSKFNPVFHFFFFGFTALYVESYFLNQVLNLWACKWKRRVLTNSTGPPEKSLSLSDITVSFDKITTPFAPHNNFLFWTKLSLTSDYIMAYLNFLYVSQLVLQSYKCEIEDYIPVTYIRELRALGCSIALFWLICASHWAINMGSISFSHYIRFYNLYWSRKCFSFYMADKKRVLKKCVLGIFHVR